MKIEEIKVFGLHRAIDANLRFKPDLGIIVGINGSGKTSIINLTAHLLRLNVPELVRVDFESIEILGRDDSGKLISIKATKKNEELELSAKKSGRKIDTFRCPSPRTDSFILEARDERMAWERYLRRTLSEIAATPLAAFLRENVRLTLVRLDRTLFAEDFTGAIAVEQPFVVRTNRPPLDEIDPISQVQKATRDRFTEYQGQLKKLNEELTNKLVLQLFQATDIFEGRRPRAPTVPDLKHLAKLENSIRKSSFYPRTTADRQAISQYFRLTKELAKEFESAPLRKNRASDIWQERFLRSALERFERLNMLAKEFNTFDSRASDAYKDIGTYLTAINRFLAESSKEAFFSEVDNTLKFKISGEDDLLGRPITELSSGEKQIVTVLAYIAYLAGKNSIFLIDEPELSLHISWQAGLLSALKSVQPEGCQLIMATHSPEIVGDQRDRVIRLVPKYRISGRSAESAHQ